MHFIYLESENTCTCSLHIKCRQPTVGPTIFVTCLYISKATFKADQGPARRPPPPLKKNWDFFL